VLGFFAFVSVVGIPWAKSCFVIGYFSLHPFGKEAISRKILFDHEDIGTGGFGTMANIIWFVFAGMWLALGHVISAIICFGTLIGIPFGIQHLKLAGLALAPVGLTIVSKEVATAARQRYAEALVSKLKNDR
jgi:uncharacterized membrane protein YccF (DUF307 family)